jgi:hypothetical protein
MRTPHKTFPSAGQLTPPSRLIAYERHPVDAARRWGSIAFLPTTAFWLQPEAAKRRVERAFIAGIILGTVLTTAVAIITILL